MFSTTTYLNRRTILKNKIKEGLILLMGNELSPMNYKDNTYRFRQDSNFLYYIGINQPDLVAIIDIERNETMLFGKELTIDDIIWMGAQPSLQSIAEKSGIKKLFPPSAISNILTKATASGAPIHYLPPYRGENKIKMSEWLGVSVKELKSGFSIPLVKAVVEQREVKSAEEIAAIEKALDITAKMHTTAMRFARPGMTEAQVAGRVYDVVISAGGELAYPVIMTVEGQQLHNHYHGNILQEGQLLLGDFGAETPDIYSGDITRTFPVSKTFTSQQKAIYEIVLNTQLKAIESCRAGVSYQSIHLEAAKEIAQGLRELGLMKGDMEEAVSVGAHALFFPHGLGHPVGMDVHDMEDLGEQYVGYDEKTIRSTQFGLRSLRFGKALQKGYVMTVEPGIYFIPELIDLWKSENKFTDFINYSEVEKYRNFSGIRIEDNIVINESDCQVLGTPIPKTIEEVEAMRREE